jgi:hypothetical protein
MLLTKPLCYELNLLYAGPDEDDEVEGAVVEDAKEVLFTGRERARERERERDR